MGHAFAEAALLDEFLFEAADLLVEEVVGLVEEADCDVGNDFGGAGFAEGAVGLIGDGGGLGEFAGVGGFFGVFGPEGVGPGAEVVFVVDEEFFEAGAGDVGEFDFGFGGGSRGFAAFRDVLLAGSCGLDHLVDGAVASREEAVAEVVGEVVDDLGFLKGDEVVVVTAGWEEAGGTWIRG